MPPVDLRVPELLPSVAAVGSPSAYTSGSLVAVSTPGLEIFAFSGQVHELAVEDYYSLPEAGLFRLFGQWCA